jgi:hypothetical protein
MSKLGSRKWYKEVDAITQQAAMEIRAAFEKMVRGLPEDAAPQMALELVIGKLGSMTETPPIDWFMQLIMEDPDIKETYWAAVAAQPLPPRKGRPSRI